MTAQTTTKGRTGSRTGLVVLVTVAVLLAAAAALFVVGYLQTGNKVPAKTTVDGVAIGGMRRDEALDALEAGLKERAAAPVAITQGDRTFRVDAAKAGLAIDYEATVEATGAQRSFDPRHILRVLTGGGPMDPVVVVDDKDLAAAGAEAAKELHRDAVNAKIELKKNATTPSITKAKESVEVDPAVAASTLRAAYLADGPPPEVQAAHQKPAIDDADVRTFQEEWLGPALASPIRVDTAGKGAFELTPAMIARAITITTPDDNRLEGSLDAKKLRSAADSAIDALKIPAPQDPSVTFPGGRPKVVPGKDGFEISAEALHAAVNPVLTSPKGREVTVTPVEKKSDGQQAGADITEVVGEFTTRFPYAKYRNQNLGQAASRINGTVLAPGATFSLNDRLGRRTVENGYTDGYVISNGALVKETGGGVSQSATTVFNAAFAAGYKDVEHHAHSLYFDRYPAGREATVYYGSLDLRFQNDTPYWSVMQAFVNPASPGGQGSITVKIWSRKNYQRVEVPTPTKSNFTDPGPARTESGDKCHAQSAARGFTASFSRTFVGFDNTSRRENFSHTYQPQVKITCRS